MRKEFIVISFFVLIILISGCMKTAPIKPEEQIQDRSFLDVKERGVIVIGTFAKIPLMTYLGESGNFMGHDIDIAKEIASEMGVSIEFKDIFFPDMLEAVKTGEVNIAVSSITITPERSEGMLFSIPYFNAGQVIITRADNEDIKGPEDMEGKKIGVIKGTTGEKTVLELDYIDPSLVKHFDEEEDRAKSLLDREIDVFVEDVTGATGIVKNNPELKIVGEPFTQETYGIATKPGNKALMDEINKILMEMKRSGKLEEIENDWFS